MNCWFSRFGWGPCDFAPRNAPDPCHLIPQQRLRDAGISDLDDERLIVDGCRYHHGLFDRKLRLLAEDDFPPKLLAFAQDEGFFFDAGVHEWKAQAA